MKIQITNNKVMAIDTGNFDTEMVISSMKAHVFNTIGKHLVYGSDIWEDLQATTGKGYDKKYVEICMMDIRQ